MESVKSNLNEKTKSLESILKTITTKYDSERVITALDLITKLLSNVLNQPEEEKFRKFKKTNEAIKTKILNITECAYLMKEIGYNDIDDDFMSYTDSNIDSIKIAVDLFTKQINLLEAGNNSEEENMNENRKMFLKQEEEDQFDEEELDDGVERYPIKILVYDISDGK